MPNQQHAAFRKKKQKKKTLTQKDSPKVRNNATRERALLVVQSFTNFSDTHPECFVHVTEYALYNP